MVIGESTLYDDWFAEWQCVNDAAMSHFFHTYGYAKLSCDAHLWITDERFFDTCEWRITEGFHLPGRR